MPSVEYALEPVPSGVNPYYSSTRPGAHPGTASGRGSTPRWLPLQHGPFPGIFRSQALQPPFCPVLLPETCLPLPGK